MIDIASYAQQIENGLNALLQAGEDEELAKHYSFIVSPEIGIYKRAERQDRTNEIHEYISCVLTSTASPNETISSGLVIAVENLTLRVNCPLFRVRTSRNDTPVSIDDNGVFVFVQKIRDIVNTFFAVNKIDTIEAGGKTYAVGYGYTMSATGMVDNLPMVGEVIPFSAYVSLNIVQNGINSKDIKIEIDGEQVPFLTFSPERAVTMGGTVFSDGTGASKAVISSTTIAFTLSVPAVIGSISDGISSFLLDGDLNACHIVRLEYGDKTPRYYIMTYGNTSASAQGVTNAGLSIPLYELAFIPELMAFPDYYQVERVELDETGAVTFSVNRDCIVVLSSTNITDRTEGESVTVTFSDMEREYDEENGKYYGYIIVCPIDKTGTGDIITIEV